MSNVSLQPGAPPSYPGERFYPPGVIGNPQIATGTLGDFLGEVAERFGNRTAIEFRDWPIRRDRPYGQREGVARRYLPLSKSVTFQCLNGKAAL